jgi:cell surface protein SprA
LFFSFSLNAQNSSRDTVTSPDKLRFPIKENNYPFSNSKSTSPMLLNPPSNVKQEVVYNPSTGGYEFSEKVGNLNYRPPSSMTFDQYKKYEGHRTRSTYWQEKSREESGAGPSFMKSLRVGNQAFDKVFGTDVINIIPKGSADLIFGYTRTRNDNPQLPLRNQRNGSFVFKEKIKLNVTGTIGDKMEVTLNFDTEATFDFENKKKLEYTGKEDEIIKKIEAGDVSFNVPGSLIKGSQSLFGLKTELQFGRLTVASVLSHQKGESRSINVKGGAQETEFEINVDDYDVNKHFFLAHFFRDNYNNWLKNLPYIESQVQIQQVEVWIVNKQGDYEEKRNIVAFMDLGEGYNPKGERNFYAPEDFIRPLKDYNLPVSNENNEIYRRLSGNDLIRDLKSIDQGIKSEFGTYNNNKDFEGFEEGRDYVKLESARPLSDREYTINRELGYISLNSPLRNDEILAVAFTYTYKGETYSVGEIAQNQSGTLILKMLKGTIPTPRFPTWDLMMKNVYSIGAYQLSSDNFVLNVLYKNDRTGMPVNYLAEKDTLLISSAVNEQILVKVLDLDNLDSRNEPSPDGVFDFVEGVTVNSRNGRIYFPLLEPFGADLRAKIVGNYNENVRGRIADKYVFEELYDSTQTKAKQMAEKNKFMLQGTYKSSSSSEIPLNATNIPRGSVKVTSGGMTYTEGVDYTVDYVLGRVKIINSGLLESGTPLQVSLESNSLFNIQTKTLMGTHMNYKFSENFNIGGTIMHLTERPLTSKVNMGEEPISNTIWGLNTSYRTQSQWLTTMVDKLPLLETKEPSSIAFEGEFAQLIPRQAKIIDKNGQAYIDDFEAAEIKIDLKTVTEWKLGSAPKNSALNSYSESDGLESGFGRSKLAWFYIDPVFYGKSSLKPGNIDDDPDDLGIDNHYTRRINTKDIFPQMDDNLPGQNYLSVLNVSYYPNERGPYNYDPSLTSDGKLTSPRNRWGAMTRSITNSDFETSNIEYIEFWMMDPFLDNDTSAGGDLYFHLGEISEDVLRDSRKTYENGFPTDPTDTKNVDYTVWGRVPKNEAISEDFDVSDRKAQDIGLDGLNDDMERSYLSGYLNSIPPSTRPIIEPDVAADDFQYFLDDAHDEADHNILERYKNYNGLENNSASSSESGGEYTKSSTTKPDVEDINDDKTLNTSESYFQYNVSLRSEDLEVGKNFIVDRVEHSLNGRPEVWYQFRIPLSEPDERFGLIEDFKSIRFMRMVITNFEEPVFLRFATLGLVRGDWRRYEYDMSETGPSINNQDDGTTFEVSAVNIEENSLKRPVNYVLPPGIDRVIDPYQSQSKELNEQSLLLKVNDLKDGDARSVFKNVEYDLRQYKNLKMFIHAEEIGDEIVDHGEVTAFIRFGSDYQNNYYEYEVPLRITDPAADGKNTDKEVWPEGENMIVLALQDLVNLKQERNDAIHNDPRNFSEQTVFSKQIPKNIDKSDNSPLEGVSNTLKVKGNPNLGNIRQIMLGIRNPGDATSQVVNDGEAKSIEVWFNELMLTDFNNKGGWAANGRIQTQLADFGVVNVAGSTSKPGFGSIEEKVEERSHEEINQIDVSTNLEMGKFFPEKANVSIPLYAGLTKTIINPEYFPGDPDIKFKDVLANASGKSERDSLKKISQDYTSRKAINLTNVRWNKQLKKIKIISPANFTAGINYAYTGSHNYTTEYNNTRKYGADFNYVFNTRPKNIQPLKKAKFMKKPAFRLIRDFNFDPYPSRISFSTYFDRNYQEMKMRDINEEAILKIDSTINKDFRWDRKYNLKWDLSRSLKIDYSATNVARIDEPAGGYDWFEKDNQQWKDSVWQNIKQFGRNMNFSQTFDVSYQVPINKIPLLGWLSVNTSYGSTFSWQRGEILRDQSRNLGNTIKNSNTIKGSANINLRTIYNKVGYLKRLDTEGSTKKKDDETKRVKEVKFEKQTFFKKDVPKNFVHKLGTDKVTVKVINSEGGEISVNTAIVNDNKITVTAAQDISSATIIVTGEVPLGKSPLVFIAENTTRLITGFKSISITMSETKGTLLPGYLHETDYLGIDASTGDPGLPFVLGWQDWSESTIRNYMLDSSLTNDATFNKSIIYTKNQSFSIRTTYEPYRGLRIDLTANRSYSETNQQLYFYDEERRNVEGTNYFLDNRYKGGNFSISIISLASAFEKVSEDNHWESAAFERMKTYRRQVSDARYRELTEKYPIYENSGNQITSSYNYGYGPTSQEVLVPAFIAAYTGMNPENKELTQFFWTMMPNWRITFDGLSKVEFLQEYFKTITITHSYKSTYSIGSFATNVNYFDEPNENGSDYFGSGSDEIRHVMLDNQGNIMTKYMFSGVSIKEDMTPLVGVELGWNNSLLTRFQIGRSRMLALSLTNNQLNETRNKDFSIGAGYTFKEVAITINQKPIKSDLDVKIDWTIKDNISIIRVIPISPLDERDPEVTEGIRKHIVSFTADYMLNAKLNLQLYFDYTLNKPHTTGTFLNTQLNVGFSLKLTL